MITIQVSGMQCASCVAALRAALPPEHSQANIDLPTGRVQLDVTSPEQEAACSQAIQAAGFSVESIERHDW